MRDPQKSLAGAGVPFLLSLFVFQKLLQCSSELLPKTGELRLGHEEIKAWWEWGEDLAFFAVAGGVLCSWVSSLQLWPWMQLKERGVTHGTLSALWHGRWTPGCPYSTCSHFWNHDPLKDFTEEFKGKGVIMDQHHNWCKLVSFISHHLSHSLSWLQTFCARWGR